MHVATSRAPMQAAGEGGECSRMDTDGCIGSDSYMLVGMRLIGRRSDFLLGLMQSTGKSIFYLGSSEDSSKRLEEGCEASWTR
jgi:hypothetical protein